MGEPKGANVSSAPGPLPLIAESARLCEEEAVSKGGHVGREVHVPPDGTASRLCHEALHSTRDLALDLIAQGFQEAP
jgi:hypothetical protein